MKREFEQDEISEELIDLLSRMLQIDPYQRIELQEILEHEWLTYFAMTEPQEIEENLF